MIVNKLSEIMGRKRVRISTVAKETGLSRATVHSLYYDRTKHLTLKTMDQLCRYLGCQVGDIFEFVDDQEPKNEGR